MPTYKVGQVLKHRDTRARTIQGCKVKIVDVASGYVYWEIIENGPHERPNNPDYGVGFRHQEREGEMERFFTPAGVGFVSVYSTFISKRESLFVRPQP